MRVTPECDSISSVNISSATGLQVTPAVAFDDNNYMVVWSDARSGNYYRVYGARVSPAGTVLDPAGILIGPATETFQLEPAISFADTIFFVVWVYHSSPFAVTGRFVHCDGTLGDSVRIASLTDEAYMTSVAYDGTNYLVAWTQYPDLLKGQLVSAGGNLIGSTFTIATGVANLGSGRISFDGNKYTVVYTVRNIDIFEVWGRQYDISGNPLGSAFIISNPAYSSYDSYIVAGAANYFNVWTHMEYPSDIYGNVDLQIGIEDYQTRPVEQGLGYTSTITSSPLALPDDKECKVFDISGREIAPHSLRPGIYFVVIDNSVIQKVIKVR